MVSHWSLSDNKFPKVSKILLSILADLNNAVYWMVSTRPLISKYSSPYTNPLVTVPRVPITIGIIVSFMFHNCFNSLAKWRYLFLFLYSFNFTLWSAGTGKFTILQVLFFWWIRIRSGRPADIWHLEFIFIIIIYSLEFFTWALADGFSLGFQSQRVSSNLLDSPQYSGRSQ